MTDSTGLVETPKGTYEYPPICTNRQGMAVFQEVLDMCANEINTEILPWLRETHPDKVGAFTKALNDLHAADTVKHADASKEGAAYFPMRFDEESARVIVDPIGEAITLNQFRDEMTRLYNQAIRILQSDAPACSKHRAAVGLESFKTELSHKISSGPIKTAYSMFQTTVPENTPFRGC